MRENEKDKVRVQVHMQGENEERGEDKDEDLLTPVGSYPLYRVSQAVFGGVLATQSLSALGRPPSSRYLIGASSIEGHRDS